MQKNKIGKIIIPATRQPWPHELYVAHVLAKAGHLVEFLPEANIKTADILLDGVEYEIKSPITNSSKKIMRNIKHALEQCENVIIDSSRIKNMKDKNIERLLKSRYDNLPKLKRLIFVSKQGDIIDIKK